MDEPRDEAMDDGIDDLFDVLDDDQLHDAVVRWIDEQGDAPDGFADSVVAQADAEAVAATDAASPTRLPVAIVGALAAAALVLLALAPRWLSDRANADAPAVAMNEAAPIANEVASVPAASTSPLRAQMRDVLAARCVPCHEGGNAKAEAGALDVFDVSVQRWWSPMSARQLGVLRQRLVDAPGGANDAALVDAFVDAELAHRRG